MSPEPPPIADPHSTSIGPRQSSSVPRAKGIALLGLTILGCLAIASGIAILGAVTNGVMPVLNRTVGPIDAASVLGTIMAAVLGCLLCWGGYHLLRMAFGNGR